MKKLCLLALIFFSSCFAKTFEPRVTIITPLHSQEPIEDFLHMITSQPFFKESELILMSADDITSFEKETVKKYQYTFKNINSMFTQGSISILINFALQSAKGDYITLMRIEDYRAPQTFKSQLETLHNDQTIDVVYSDYHTSYSANTPTDNADNWYLNELPKFDPQWLYRDVPGPHVMWRKSLHERQGYLLSNFMFHYWWEFWNRCGKNGIIFKKVKDKPGTYHFNYFNQKKILHTGADFAKSYQEEKYIRETYQSMWNSRTTQDKRFVIITASYNNKDWYQRNLDSLLNQEYKNYRIIYIDDKSPDQTGKLVQEYAKELNKQHLINVIINDANIGALANIYNAIHSCDTDEICVLVDGDDALAHNHVLEHLNAVYQDPYVWLTYGQFEWFPERMPGFVFQLPGWVIERNSIREYLWVTSHLRTFYAGLFQKIKKEDLMFNGEFFSKAWDLGIMYPMVEMAAHHCRFINEILYSYNTANQINDNKVNLTLQDRIDKYIRNQPRYHTIASWQN